MNLSGGIFWHGRAWAAQSLWRQTCAEIATALARCGHRASELLLIGASAGWMIPTPWLQGFAKVDTWDIDPLAAPLFRWRHGAALKASGCALQCHRFDALSGLEQLLQAHPDACVFFDNVLGQYRFYCSDPDEAAEKIAQIVHSLRGREWGSLHETYSGPVHGNPGLPAMQQRVQGSADSAARDVQWFEQLGATGEWLDHMTGGVFADGTLVHHIAWPFKPGTCHWLQLGWVRYERSL
ncbi:MAG: hypothetical protein WCH78_13980 [Bacteroidota bacterium]